jgi:hypothetical protein
MMNVVVDKADKYEEEKDHDKLKHVIHDSKDMTRAMILKKV